MHMVYIHLFVLFFEVCISVDMYKFQAGWIHFFQQHIQTMSHKMLRLFATMLHVASLLLYSKMVQQQSKLHVFSCYD